MRAIKINPLHTLLNAISDIGNWLTHRCQIDYTVTVQFDDISTEQSVESLDFYNVVRLTDPKMVKIIHT